MVFASNKKKSTIVPTNHGPQIDFMTIYTDASVRPQARLTQVAWRGKCAFGWIQGARVLEFDPRVARAEMLAIFYAIESALSSYPELIGFFINSDNLQCVQAFWTFRNKALHRDIVDVHERIRTLAGHRWIRAKHVKAHTRRKDIRSYMNRTVDKLTRTRIK